MSHNEKKLTEALSKKCRELDEARAGLVEINKLMDAILCRIGLEYGAKLPDGAKVLTLNKRPTVGLLEDYEIRTSRLTEGGYRITVWKKEKKSEEQGA